MNKDRVPLPECKECGLNRSCRACEAEYELSRAQEELSNLREERELLLGQVRFDRNRFKLRGMVTNSIDSVLTKLGEASRA